MPPDDPTPLGDAMTHRFPEQKIPEPEPGSAEARQREQSGDITSRPSLPDHPRAMDADIAGEDEPQGQGKTTEQQRKLPANQRG